MWEYLTTGRVVGCGVVVLWSGGAVFGAVVSGAMEAFVVFIGERW